MNKNRKSTRENYHKIWKLFNQFLLKLDILPQNWETRVYLFVAHLVNKGRKSATIKSYVSAIKTVLEHVDYKLCEDTLLLNAITRACRIHNNCITAKLPIHVKLLEILLFEVNRLYDTQPYLKKLYQACLSIAYYGFFRIGELAESDHCVKASNVHIASNKNKILLILFSSKMHDKHSRPQKIKISADNPVYKSEFRHFCPFNLLKIYLKVRGGYHHVNEQFFIFSDGSPLKPGQVCTTLKNLIKCVGLDEKLYSFHGLRSGRATDMLCWGIPLETIKSLGRWK